MNGIKKLFTLIELLIVIVILGILVAIIFPNTSSWKDEAIKAEIISNIRNYQTAVDAYRLDNHGKLPTSVVPTITNPQRIDFNKLYPKYTKMKKPKDGYYWVDAYGAVWGSTIDAPKRITYTADKFSFEAVYGAEKYEIYEAKKEDSHSTQSSAYQSSAYDYNIVSLNTVENKNETKIINAPITKFNNKAIYLVNAYDRFGLPTPPVGATYQGADEFLPFSGIGSFELITDAGGKAFWEGIKVIETKPSGTDIKYSFATSDNGKNYTSFTDDISTVPQSRYMKVKVEMIGSAGKMPTLHYLKVQFHLIDQKAKSIDAPVEMQNVVVTPEGILLKDGETNGSITHIVNTQNNDYFEEVSIIGVIPENANIKQTYQSSTDGINYSEPTYYPEELPKGSYIKIVTEIERPNTTTPSPVIKDMFVVQTPNNPNKIDYLIPSTSKPTNVSSDNESNENHSKETISTLTIVEDAGEIGDWIRVDVEETKPAGTYIRYEYFTSNDETNWSGPYNTVAETPNSQFFKVNVIFERDKGSNNTPVLNRMMIVYNKLNGEEVKKIRIENGVEVNKTSISYDSFFIKENFSTITYRDSYSTADWLGGTLSLNTKPFASFESNISFTVIKDVLHDSKGNTFVATTNFGSSYDNTDNKMNIYKHNQNMEVVKVIEIPRSLLNATMYNSVQIESLEEKHGGGYIAFINNRDRKEYYFVELNENLDILNKVKWTNPFTNGSIYSLSKTDDGYVMVSSTEGSNISNGSEFVKYDKNFNIISRKSYVTSGSNYYNYIGVVRHFNQGNDGNYYGVITYRNKDNTVINPYGFNYNPSGTSYIEGTVLLKFDSNLNLIDHYFVQGSHQDETVNYYVLSDGRVVFGLRNEIHFLNKNLDLIKKEVGESNLDFDAATQTPDGKVYALFQKYTYSCSECLSYNPVMMIFDQNFNQLSTYTGTISHWVDTVSLIPLENNKVGFSGTPKQCRSCKYYTYAGILFDTENTYYNTNSPTLVSKYYNLGGSYNKVKIIVDADTPAGTSYDIFIQTPNYSSGYINQTEAEAGKILQLGNYTNSIKFTIRLYGNATTTPKIKFVGINPM